MVKPMSKCNGLPQRCEGPTESIQNVKTMDRKDTRALLENLKIRSALLNKIEEGVASKDIKLSDKEINEIDKLQNSLPEIIGKLEDILKDILKDPEIDQLSVVELL